MKIQFDIKYRPQIESGEYKVETRDGEPARVICWDAKGTFPIVALVEENEKDFPWSFTENGSLYTDAEDGYDLFLITPEPELTEFEKELAKVISEWLSYPSISYEFYAREVAPKLLSIAYKEAPICRKED